MSAADRTVGIRRATPADLPALEILERQGFPEPWSRRSLAAELRQPAALLLVAEAGDEAVGYAAFRRAADEAELLRIVVARAARGRGIGRRLTAAGLDELSRRGVRRCFLEVRPGNAPARALYRRLGFREAGLRRAYYPDGSDALVLARSLALPRSPQPAI